MALVGIAQGHRDSVPGVVELEVEGREPEVVRTREARSLAP